MTSMRNECSDAQVKHGDHNKIESVRLSLTWRRLDHEGVGETKETVDC